MINVKEISLAENGNQLIGIPIVLTEGAISKVIGPNDVTYTALIAMMELLPTEPRSKHEKIALVIPLELADDIIDTITHVLQDLVADARATLEQKEMNKDDV